MNNFFNGKVCQFFCSAVDPGYTVVQGTSTMMTLFQGYVIKEITKNPSILEKIYF